MDGHGRRIQQSANELRQVMRTQRRVAAKHGRNGDTMAASRGAAREGRAMKDAYEAQRQLVEQWRERGAEITLGEDFTTCAAELEATLPQIEEGE